jgi:hypothetical protein
VSLGLVGFAAWKWKTDPPHPAFDLSFALMVAVSVMVSYHLNGYDMSLLLIPLLLAAEWMLSRSTASTAATRLLLAATGLLFLMPLWQGIRYGALFWTVLLAALSLALSRERKRGVAQAIAVEAE